MAFGHRGANRQPSGGSARSGGLPADRRGEFDPVVKGDPEGGDAHCGQFAAGCLRRQQVAGGADATLETGLRTKLTAAAHGC